METVLQLIEVQKDRVKNLERQRDIFRHDSTPKNSKFILTKKLEIFQRIYQDFLDSHIQLSAFGAELRNNDYFKNSIFDKLHEVYFEILADLDIALQGISDENERTGTTAINVTSNRHSNKIKLPPLQMPKFSGKYTEWSSFWDQFNAMFHVDPQLLDVQKMQFLQGAVQGPAADLIRHLPVTDNNYAEARRLLQARFENRRAIFTNAMNQLLSIPRSKKDTVMEIQQLSSMTHETMQCFKNIQAETASTILAHLVIDKFPPETRKKFERKIASSRELPTIEEVHEQLELALRTVESLQSQEDPQMTKPKPKTITSFHTQSKMSSEGSATPVRETKKCVMCQQIHSIRDCPKFLELSAELRRKEAQKLKLCFNCLSSQHIRAKCNSKFGCRQCGQRHHSLLHTTETTAEQTGIDAPSTSEVKILTSNYSNMLCQPTLLSTAIVKIQSANGSFIPMRALIDGGGTASAITSSAVQLLQLPQVKCHIDVTHLDKAQSKSSSIASFLLKSNVNEFEIDVQALVMKSLTSLLPSGKVNGARWPHIDLLELADPTFAEPGPIDLILGAGVYAEIMLPDIRKGPRGTPTAQKTELGWILLGKAHSVDSTKQIAMLHTNILRPTIEQLMETFLQIEDVGRENQSPWSKEDQYCFDFFKETTRRDENGLFIIRFPLRSAFDQSAVLGSSRATALRQFLSLERRFMKNPEY